MKLRSHLWHFSLFLLLLLVGFTVKPARAAAAARIYVSPSSGSYKVGDKLTAAIMIDSGGQAINAAEGKLSFSTDTLEYQSVSTSGTIFTFWTSGPTASGGSVSFSGGLSNPGYTGSSGKVLSVTFRAKKNGKGTISLSNNKILANDGNGTNVYGSSSGASYTIGPAAPALNGPTVTSTTHPDSNKWYSANTVTVNWSGSKDITGYVFAIDQSASTDPTGTPSSTTSKTFTSVADGTWYFHVKGKIPTGFTPVTHFRIQIDTVAPETFSVTVDQAGGVTNPTPKLLFEARDALSGIDRYEASIDGGTPFAITSGVAIPKTRPGDHSVVIKAYDKAGNSRESKVTFSITGISPPIITDWTRTIGLLDLAKFIGRSDSDDTIIVYLGEKEVERFVARDKQVPYSTISRKDAALAVSDKEIAWEYDYKQLLLPKVQSFSFSRINVAGAESGLTQPYPVTILTSAIKIGRWIFSSQFVLLLLLVIIALLILIIILLWHKLLVLAKRCRVGLIAVGKRMKRPSKDKSEAREP